MGDFFQDEKVRESVFLRKKASRESAPKDPSGNYEILASSVMDIRIVPMLLTLREKEELEGELAPQGREMLGVALAGRLEIGVNGKLFTRLHTCIVVALAQAYAFHCSFAFRPGEY